MTCRGRLLDVAGLEGNGQDGGAGLTHGLEELSFVAGALGLAPGASFAEIKASYRKLSMQYHPDKVAHLGEEFKKVAEEKMKEINSAYEFLQRKHGG